MFRQSQWVHLRIIFKGGSMKRLHFCCWAAFFFIMGSISTGAVFALSNTVWVGTGGMDAKIVATKDTVIEIHPNPEKYKVKGGYNTAIGSVLSFWKRNSDKLNISKQPPSIPGGCFVFSSSYLINKLDSLYLIRLWKCNGIS